MISTLLSYLNGAAAVIVVLGLCLLCHEAGHFFVAKLFNMKVEEFAFGFGRALWQRRRGETTYRLNLVPFGGYVKIAGMEPGSENVDRGFHSYERWKGALVIVAGSLANILLAIVLFTVVTLWTGVPDPTDEGIYIGKVSSGTPAAKAGLQRRDEILAVDGQRHALDLAEVRPGSVAATTGMTKDQAISKVGELEVYTPRDLLAALKASAGSRVRLQLIDYNARDIASQFINRDLTVPPNLAQPRGEPVTALEQALGVKFARLHQGALVGYISARPAEQVTLTVQRDSQTLDVPVTTAVTSARYATQDAKGKLITRFRDMGRIGVVLRGASKPVAVPQALKAGVVRTYGAIATVIISIRMMVKQEVGAELAGPVAIMAISVERSRVGWDAVLNWTGIISSILAIMNLFPFPPFDGFKVALLGLEGAMRRRVDARLELIVSFVGVILVLMLIVALTFKDITNMVLHGTP